MSTRAVVLLALLLATLPLRGEEPPQAPIPPPPPERPARQEVVVVTPCRGCATSVINSPAAVSVISSEAIETAADRSLPELIRTLPGENAVRTSVRDFNVTSRQATSTLSHFQLVLVDGRSVYQDFIGVILWDMVPVDPSDIEQIEVVRGPASAVWGANAFTGVVNIITRSPRVAEGSAVRLSLTRFNRDAGSKLGQGAGMAYAGSTTLSRVLSERVAYRISGGYSASDPAARPVGDLPFLPHPMEPGLVVGGGRLPADDQGRLGDFANRGTTQPWLDLRFEQEVGRGRISYGSGVAGSDGIVHSGIGPFNLERGSYLGYGRVSYSRDLLRATAFVNRLSAQAPNLLALDADKKPVNLQVRTLTYDLELSHSILVAGQHILTYGGNVRRNTFDISLAPAGRDRTEVGVYAQEEFFFEWGEAAHRREFRVVAGARVDKFGNLDGAVLSPRLSLIWKPGPNHSVRASFNRAFRSPSVINNYLDQVILRPVDLKPLFPNLPTEYLPLVQEDFALPQRALGKADLREESLTSYEIGYIGTVQGKTTLGLNLYLNDSDDNINFTRLPDSDDPYTAANPPPGWPLPASYLSDLAAGHKYLARTANQFRNLGPLRIGGVELFLEHHFPDGITGYLNYSWQPDPKPLSAVRPFPRSEISLPPRNRVNAGVYWSGPRLVGSLSLNQADRAFWVDVLPHDYDGYTAPYTMFNASFGVRWAAGRIVTTLRGTNLTNADVQQHSYGDIFKRSLVADVRFAF